MFVIRLRHYVYHKLYVNYVAVAQEWVPKNWITRIDVDSLMGKNFCEAAEQAG